MSSPGGGSGSLPIPGKGPAASDLLHPLSASFRSSSPLANEVLARDLEACPDDDELDSNVNGVDDAEGSETSDDTPGPTLYRRPSGIAFGATRPALSLGPAGLNEQPILSHAERARSREAERSLLRDNHILPPKHNPSKQPRGPIATLYRRLFSTKVPRRESDEEDPITETTALLSEDRGRPGAPESHTHHHEHLNSQWEAAVAAGQIKTTWQREAKTIAVYSRSLIVTFVLQYSLQVTSIFAVGRLGTLELGAVSLASMTATITCNAPVQGLATSLDTLCAQAYGSGHKKLVGLQMQRMIYFLLLLIAPIGAIWLNSEAILLAVGIQPPSAALASTYLKIMLLGVPANMIFEAGKRFVQAQGLFHATTYVLLIAAPTNIFLSWFFVWYLQWGFKGAPLAVILTQNMLPTLLFLYVWKFEGSEAWGGFRRAAFRNWGPMIRLALPGMVMVVAEWLAFEILTLACGRLGVATLAAQSIIMTVAATTFQLPFPMSIAGSTRVANLIGAKLVDAAKTSAKVTVAGGVLIGCFNVTLLWVFRYQIPILFTNDEEVIALVADVLPLVAVMQLFDGMAAVSHGLLRGIGRQEFGGYANLVIYYVVAVPISFGFAFGLGWELKGLWFGVTIGLCLVAIVEYVFIYLSDWNIIVKEAEARNTSG